jgi:hypothetical protein
MGVVRVGDARCLRPARLAMTSISAGTKCNLTSRSCEDFDLSLEGERVCPKP